MGYTVGEIGCRCEVMVTETDRRAKLWTAIRGRLAWPVLSFVPTRDASGRNFYQGRLDDLTNEQLWKLFGVIADWRGAAPSSVAGELFRLGYVPIMDDGLAVAICTRHTRMFA